MEIAGTSDVVWLLTLGVSERPNEKVMNRETLVLYGWTMHEGCLLRALHDGSLVGHIHSFSLQDIRYT